TSRMRAIRENRVLGAAREIVEEAPELELVAPRNVLLCRVAAEALAIVPDDTLEVAGAPEAAERGEPLELLLYLPAPLLHPSPSRRGQPPPRPRAKLNEPPHALTGTH